MKMGAAVGVLVTTAAAWKAAWNSLQMVAEMKRNADMAGISAKAYQELTFAAGKYQVTQDALTDGLKELALRADEFVVTEAGPALEAFERLGYSQAELNRKLKDTPSLLLDIIDRMQGLEQAAKIRVADELFGGTGGEQFVAMINAGSGAIEELTKKANDLGLVMSDETAAGALEAYNAVKTLTQQLKVQFNTIVAELAPDLGEMAENMSAWVAQNKEFLTQDMPEMIRGIASAVSFLSYFMSGAANHIAVISQTLALLTEGEITLSQFLLSNPKELAALVEQFDAKMGGFKHTIDENTEGFDRYSKATEKAGKSTNDLNDNLKDTEQSAKDALADLIQLNHELYEKDYGDSDDWKAGFERLENLKQEIEYMEDWIDLIEQGQTTQEASLTIEEAKVRVRLDNEGLNLTEIQHYIDLLETTKELTQAEEDRITATEEYNRKQEKARQEYEREWERIYDDMHKFAADTFYDIFDGQLDSFEDFADSMLDIFKRMLANMAAEAAMTNIFKPLMNQMVGSMMGDFFGLPSAAGGGTTMFPSFGGMSSLPGMGWLGATIPGSTNAAMLSGGASQGMLYPGGISGPVPGGFDGVTWGTALGAGALGGLGYTSLGGALGLPQSEYSGITSGLGAAGMSAYGGSLATMTGISALGGPVGIALGALLGGGVGGLFGDDKPSPRFGIFQGTQAEDPNQYPFHVRANDLDIPGLGKATRDYFDERFSLLEGITASSVTDIINQRGDWGNATYIDPTGFENGEDVIKALENVVFRELREGLVTDTIGAELADVFDRDFFKDIAAEGELAFDTFARFANVANTTEGFMEEFNRRIEEVGQSTVDAYQDMQVVTQIAAEMDAAYQQVMGVGFTSVIEQSIATWDAYIDALKEAEATAEKVTEAERKKSVVVGAQITGLTKTSVQQALGSGQSVDQIVSNSLEAMINEQLAETIFKDLEPVLEQAGQTYIDSGRDIEAAIGVIKAAGFDLLESVEDVAEQTYANTRSILEDLVDQEYNLVQARRDAAQNIEDFVNSLYGSTQGPVQSLEFFEKRYAQLLLEAQGAETVEEISRTVGNLTDFTGQYLDFAGAYGGTDYVSTFNRVIEDMNKLGVDQLQAADSQELFLQGIENILGRTEVEVVGIHAALLDYIDSAIESGNVSDQFWENIKQVIESPEMGGGARELDEIERLYAAIGRTGYGNSVTQIDQGGYDYWTQQAELLSNSELEEKFFTAVDSYMARNPDDRYTKYMELQGFDGGGISSGPTSGYPIISHGEEAHIPVKNGSIPVQIQSDEQAPSFNVVIKMGDKEFRDFTVDVIRTDPEAQHQIGRVTRRVVNG